ncbi:magnesium transporter CorA family protein [Streptosporangium roseum]|uniref:Mg2+ and Co2+ transporter-like protein n=1 Tax=Streptosporangium roseum (strain ATCC 12428 / DSM 43021 / JCM 3005 / KCTC 9067 / NCIMB 10171 / NRRL 2505 / NI 9100) TaxID=479432 RepID=D2BFL6_STRRD|nr:magnesium transporter CorA family protein [Streptosporangium roseum]ACZ90177.1 Mg2+ and Co2+ transporter-like protein [Streptosporangium roseum DSM 43021]
MDVRLVGDEGVVEERPVEELAALLDREDSLVWVDIPGCDPGAVRVLSEVFGFHPMAIRDCVERNRVPKVHAYPDHLFVVLHAPARGMRGHVHYVELDQFVGRNYVVTVHGPVNPAVEAGIALRETRAVLARIMAGRLHPATPSELSYAIVSALIRNQEDYVETVTSDVWRLEQRVTGGQVGDPEEFLDELFRARHGLLAVRTMGALGGAIYGRMTNLARVSPEGQRLVVDIADQFDRIRSLADGEREYLQGVIEFYQTTLTIKATLVGQAQNAEVRRLTEASYTQNEEIKKISAWAAIFFAPTLVGTVYGMNFNHMPELHWIVGYPLALVLMALGSAALYTVFKRRGWL